MMTTRTTVGWSLLGVGALALVATAAIATAPRPAAATRSPDDVANVTALLEAMRGVGPVPCALALTVIEGNYGWGNWNGPLSGETDPAVMKLRHWLGERITDPAVVPILRAALAPGDACVRQTAARLLGRTRHQRAIAALTEAVRDADAATRELAALGLGLSDSPGAYDPLVGGLRDAEPGVRAAAATGLGRLGDDRASAALVPLLRNDRVPAVRRAVALALGALD
jgi:HEAT repeat protein